MSDEQFAIIMNEFKKLNSRMDKLEERMDRIEARLDKLEERIDKLEARVESLEARIESLEAKVESLEARIESLEARVEGLEARMSKLETICENEFASEVYFRKAFYEWKREITAQLDRLEKTNEREYKDLRMLIEVRFNECIQLIDAVNIRINAINELATNNQKRILAMS